MPINARVKVNGVVSARAGRGITSATINGSGDLVLTYSDTTTQNVGHVVGSNGTNGSAGRGITGVTVDGSNHLIVHYTDSTTDDLGALPGGGGGLPDPAMPQLSTPFLFNSHGMNGIGWDGLDVDGNPMPVGFNKALVQHQTNSYGSYALINTFDVGATGTTDPYLPTGWVNVNGGTSRIISSGITGRGSLNSLDGSTVVTVPFGALGTTVSGVALDCSSPHQDVIVTAADPSGFTDDMYVVLGLDGTNNVNPNCMLIAVTFTDVSTPVTLIAYRFHSDGSFVTVTFSSGFTLPADFRLGFKVEDSALTIYDPTTMTTLATADSGPPLTGQFVALLSSPGSPNILYTAASVSAAVVTPGPWQTKAALTGGGAALITESGTVRLVAENLSGSLGTPSSSFSVSYPPVPPRNVADLGDVNLTLPIQQNDGLFWDGTSKWINHQVEFNTQNNVGATGSADPLPATPTTYLQIRDLSGTVYCVPAYPIA